MTSRRGDFIARDTRRLAAEGVVAARGSVQRVAARGPDRAVLEHLQVQRVLGARVGRVGDALAPEPRLFVFVVFVVFV